MASSLIPVISADHMQLASFQENDPFLPDEIILEIFSHLNLQKLVEFRLVACRFLKIDEKLGKIDEILALKTILQHMTPFGKKKWETFFGEVGEAPPLPELKVLKEVYKTYMLVLMPETVDGKPLTLNLFRTLAKTPKGGGHVTEMIISNPIVTNYGDVANVSSRWVLFPKVLLEGTKDRSYLEQIQIVAAKKGADYEVTHMFEAVVSIASRHVQSGECLFSDCYTRCQEARNIGDCDLQFVVGRFGLGVLEIDYDYNRVSDKYAVAAVRK